MSSARGDKGDEGRRDADHLRLQFLIVNQKEYIENISRGQSAMVRRNDQMVEENGTTQTIIMKLR
jgi:hypothetical protein